MKADCPTSAPSGSSFPFPRSGMYVVFRSCTGEDCTRVAPSHICFCGCTLSAHNMKNRRVPCTKCKCDGFQFMFQRPEEIGEYWLVRRKDFNIHTWVLLPLSRPLLLLRALLPLLLLLSAIPSLIPALPPAPHSLLLPLPCSCLCSCPADASCPPLLL